MDYVIYQPNKDMFQHERRCCQASGTTGVNWTVLGCLVTYQRPTSQTFSQQMLGNETTKVCNLMQSQIPSGTKVALKPSKMVYVCLSYTNNFHFYLPLLHVSMLPLQERPNLDLCKYRGKCETVVKFLPFSLFLEVGFFALLLAHMWK